MLDEAVRSGSGDSLTASAREAAEQVQAAIQGLWKAPADGAAFGVDDLCRHTGLSSGVVSAVVDAFTMPEAQAPPREMALRFLSGVSPLRTHPLLRDATGRVLLVHDVLHLAAVRETLEQDLKDAGRWDAYSKHRGRYLEEEAARLLTVHFPGAEAYSGFEYFVPDPEARVVQQEPSQYTKCVEADALVVVDDVALIIEAKAVALTPAARAGHGQRLRRDLSRIVTDAAEQAQRLRERIRSDAGLRLRDGMWIDLGHVRETHTVAVSLEDLSGITTVTAELVRAGLLPPGDLPWTVSLHDLRVISELVARPAELLLYLRRRTGVETTLKFVAVDELDLFLQFYSSGLWVEPDPDAVAAALPGLGSATTASRRRRSSEHGEVIVSLTGPLDDWYAYQLGDSPVPAPKPAMVGDADLVAFVDAIAETAAPGWLAAGAVLLGGSAKGQGQFTAAMRKVCTMTANDGRPHTIAHVCGTTPADSSVLIWMSVPHPTSQRAAEVFLDRYLRAKKHQLGVSRAFAFLVDGRSRRLTGMLYDNTLPGPDPLLDRLVAQ
ncbi:hypothetical protein [Kitasatospora phosalacinea]|uniref:Uncharacterized protein n=1 Tax=Kitasatospora phosalacinea TaxID=2065 RepID=A0A9W6PII0_9ACTN|nr:hypothetical protein [Kitasatospora phosalacinea]GLW56814.1 hypothetical protein Kpho01_48250 [Kitasatospora phosalacinea]